MNCSIKHVVNSREFFTYTPIAAELALQKDKNYLFELSYLSVIDVVGENAQEFLQGQLTCDVSKVSDIQMIQGAQCNIKGRILCLMDVMCWHHFKLITPSDLCEQTIHSLSKAGLLSKVTLRPNTSIKIYGFLLQNKKDILPPCAFFPDHLYAFSYQTPYCYYHLGHGFYIFLVAEDFENQFRQHFIEKKQQLGSLTWHTLRLSHLQIAIYPESRGLFLPHRLDLQKSQYISFDKGCYKGQEIIARTHYKGILKHEFNLYVIHSPQSPYCGQKLFDLDNTLEIGEVVDYSILNTDSYLVAISHLKINARLVRTKEQTEPIELGRYHHGESTHLKN